MTNCRGNTISEVHSINCFKKLANICVSSELFYCFAVVVFFVVVSVCFVCCCCFGLVCPLYIYLPRMLSVLLLFYVFCCRGCSGLVCPFYICTDVSFVAILRVLLLLVYCMCPFHTCPGCCRF